MSTRSTIPVLFDQQKAARRVLVGSTLEAPGSDQQMTLYYGNQYLF